MPMAVRLLRNSGWKFIGEFSSRLLGLVLLAVLARRLAADGFGQYAFVLAFTGLFGVVSEMGLNNWLIKTIAHDQTRAAHLLRPILYLKALSGLFTLLFTLLVASFVRYDSLFLQHVFWGMLFWLAIGWVDTLGAFLNGVEQFAVEAHFKIQQRLWGTGAALVGVWGWPHIEVILACGALGQMGVAWWSTRYLLRQWQSAAYQPLALKSWFKTCGPYWLSALFSAFYFRIDTVLLVLLARPDVEIGWYQGAYKLFEILILLPHFVLQGWFPLLAAQAAQHKLSEQRSQALKYLNGLAWPLVLGGLLLAEPLLLFFLGTGFWPAVEAWNILLWSLPLVYVNYLSFYLLTAHNHIAASVRNTGLALVINVVSNLFLIPAWGYLGCAVSTLITEGVLAVLNLNTLRRLSRGS